MGNPHKKFPSIHIAGTNGKGTVGHLLEATYRHAGYKTGLFTSPHLISFSERFRIQGKPLSNNKLVIITKKNMSSNQDVEMRAEHNVNLKMFTGRVIIYPTKGMLLKDYKLELKPLH